MIGLIEKSSYGELKVSPVVVFVYDDPDVASHVSAMADVGAIVAPMVAADITAACTVVDTIDLQDDLPFAGVISATATQALRS